MRSTQSAPVWGWVTEHQPLQDGLQIGQPERAKHVAQTLPWIKILFILIPHSLEHLLIFMFSHLLSSFLNNTRHKDSSRIRQKKAHLP